MSEYLKTLSQLLAAAQQPGWYPAITEEAISELRMDWYRLDPNIRQESDFSVPLARLMVARLGPEFSSNSHAFIMQGATCGWYFTWYFEDKYWRELARKERNYRLVVLGLPKANTAIATFRSSPLYERNLWRVILKYADVPERFIQ